MSPKQCLIVGLLSLIIPSLLVLVQHQDKYLVEDRSIGKLLYFPGNG